MSPCSQSLCFSHSLSQHPPPQLMSCVLQRFHLTVHLGSFSRSASGFPWRQSDGAGQLGEKEEQMSKLSAGGGWRTLWRGTHKGLGYTHLLLLVSLFLCLLLFFLLNYGIFIFLLVMFSYVTLRSMYKMKTLSKLTVWIHFCFCLKD